MNYTYEVEIISYGLGFDQLVVKEHENEEAPNLWTLANLLDWKEIIGMDSYFIDSFRRTKEWLKKNYPETSMKFMIFGDGIYDKNDDEIIFWKFSELNNIPIKKNDWKISSFKRTKIWILKNRPEFLI